MKYSLDTNICIYIINKRPATIIAKFAQFEPYEIGISAIVVSELQYGVAKSSHPEKNQERLDAFLAPFQILPYDESAAQVYGTIRATLEKTGQPIGREDLLIAAHALANALTLVTNNEQEFLRVPQLKVENWAV
ncbi:MAG: type II toxin-antitoxin system VapC family toxin [Candidatus Promineifilaceae bacterium]